MLSTKIFFLKIVVNVDLNHSLGNFLIEYIINPGTIYYFIYLLKLIWKILHTHKDDLKKNRGGV